MEMKHDLRAEKNEGKWFSAKANIGNVARENEGENSLVVVISAIYKLQTFKL